MTDVLDFQGFIRGVTYKAHLVGELNRYHFSEFDVNTASPYGVLVFDDGEIAYSKWVSPKRTRTYPFARIYNTYNAQKILTIIPVIKDEGLDGDLDKLQYSTISWMNLLNVYIVLGYYHTAVKNISIRQRMKNKLTGQKFDCDFIKAQIFEISQYKQSALHWNKNLFEERFAAIFENALRAYTTIASTTGVQVHPQIQLKQYIENVKRDFEQFKDISLKGSLQASVRESQTSHQFEYLSDGLKATFYIHNYLGGVYYLTADELILKDSIWTIQESKNSKHKALPDLSDIQDGLFKLIIFANLSTLELNKIRVEFAVRLKLTGKGIKGRIVLPYANDEIEAFLKENRRILKQS